MIRLWNIIFVNGGGITNMAMPVPTPHNMIPKRRMDDEERLIEKLCSTSNWFWCHMKTNCHRIIKNIYITLIIDGKKSKTLIYAWS